MLGLFFSPCHKRFCSFWSLFSKSASGYVRVIFEVLVGFFCEAGFPSRDGSWQYQQQWQLCFCYLCPRGLHGWHFHQWSSHQCYPLFYWPSSPPPPGIGSGISQILWMLKNISSWLMRPWQMTMRALERSKGNAGLAGTQNSLQVWCSRSRAQVEASREQKTG